MAREGMSEDFERNAARIRSAVLQQGFTKHLGAELEDLQEGVCVLSLTRKPELLQQHGFFHGGVAAYLIDNATTIAAGTLCKEGRAPLTAGFTLNFLSPAVGEKLICRAKVVKPGKAISVVNAEVFAVKDGKEKQTATALATIAIVEGNVLKAGDKK
jgi:uncharacterized protein (TIGR00369 family)